MKPLTFNCPICKKRKGGNPIIDHSKCAKVLQARHREAQAQPHKNSKGVAALWPSGKPITEEQITRNVRKQTAKRYKEGDQSFWDRYD